MKKVLKAIDSINEGVGKVVAFLLPVIFILVTCEVFARYILNRPTLWISEFTTALFGIYFVLAGGYVMKLKAHVSMDIFYVKWPVRVRALVDMLTFVLTATFCIALIWKGGDRALFSISIWEHSTSIWGPPVWWVKACLPIGAFLMLLQVIAKFIRDLMVLVKGEDYIGY